MRATGLLVILLAASAGCATNPWSQSLEDVRPAEQARPRSVEVRGGQARALDEVTLRQKGYVFLGTATRSSPGKDLALLRRRARQVNAALVVLYEEASTASATTCSVPHGESPAVRGRMPMAVPPTCVDRHIQMNHADYTPCVGGDTPALLGARNTPQGGAPTICSETTLHSYTATFWTLPSR